MITPERVYEVFEITPGPWNTGCIYQPLPERKETRQQILDNNGKYCIEDVKAKNANLIKASPKMLVALIESTLSIIKYGEQFTDPRFNKFLIDIEHNIKVIESADSRGRRWHELLEALEE